MRILFIEDDSDFREVVTEALESDGHEVITAGEGEQGYRLLLEMEPPPDAMILDQGIPGLSGSELIRKVREVPGGKYRALPILLMSGEKDLRLLADEMDLKFFLKKPPSLAELSRMVEAMDERRAETV